MNINAGLYVTIAIGFGLISLFRRFLNTAVRIPQWDKWLKRFWLSGTVFILADLIFNWNDDHLDDWFLFITLVVMLLTLLRIRDYRPARTLLLAIAPFALCFVVSILLTMINEALIKEYDEVIGTSWAFTSIWLFTFALIARSQKKTVEKERIEREHEAEKRRLIESQNAELERLVAERTAEITNQKEELEHTLAELRTTQTQLIQSEKMASLGELTAGIAHEIQNPLNFVNNFSEVSVELIDELTEEQQKPDRDAKLEADLLADLKQNLQRITQHGSRASSIVQGMLQHSRASSGQREPTDLNALCDEYLRLAYHGLRAKDKSFNASFSTDLDASLGPVTVVPQDIGRVLLNLFTNAFYAVQQRQKTNPPVYQPTVTVSTRGANGQVMIRVRDNGTGMPEAVKQRIFQPFFTTKPTGEGTGLGLSLSYDIVTKGHGGSLTVTSTEGEGTEFVVSIPI